MAEEEQIESVMVRDLSTLLLAGCSSSSPLIPGIFLISLYYQKYTPVASTAQVDFNAHNAIAVVVGDAVLQCRIGYFGICISPDGGSWLCSNNATALANEISTSQDPLNLIWLASQFKDMIVFPYLIIIAIIFAFFGILLLATFPSDYGVHEIEEDDIPFPSKSVSQIVICIVFIACVFVLVSVLWQHTASVAASIIAQDFGNGSVRSGVGTTAMVLGWFGFTILVLATLGLLILLLAVDTFTEVYT
ncbi:membrane fusion mating protein FIG1 [Erysiphe pulchra]|uniref:Membrane fusion mating protein FIG1 n=1 Tax=Erysiphe pulchra TaxID=225359 RepID=A0A2S4PSN9_9PEZI|nr:membrane fusion mating protein FIG1 [Erysiphe pulchra]